MARRYPRRFLHVDRLYKEGPTGLYLYTPDGVGCIWFDTYEEAMEQVGDFGRPVIVLMQKLED